MAILLCSRDTEASAYLFIDGIVAAIQGYNKAHQGHPVTLVHPGYGFLSENATFASRVATETGATWLGPRPEVISEMGLKHVARQAAIRAGVPVVPGSDGLLKPGDDDIVDIARNIGLPVILKATAGGGGMGMVICTSEDQLLHEVEKATERAKVLFNEGGVFLERYFAAARHVEIQIFGNGHGEVVHMAERECSIQRRHQKIVEETPSPFLEAHEGLRERMCNAAVALCQMIKYGSAGTVEFIVDDKTGDFFFLEMNTRIQVEHPITEEIYPGLDIVKLMIQQGILERVSPTNGFDKNASEMQQSTYHDLRKRGTEDGRHSHAIEGRIYAENPIENFAPSPGLLQHVDLHTEKEWVRLESWVSTGTTVTPFFDPLLCKVIVKGNSREEARQRFVQALEECIVSGSPNNIEYLKAIAESQFFKEGKTTTTVLNTFHYTPRALKIVYTGIDMSIQDLPGRTVGLGIPRTGPMDELAFRLGNMLVGNAETTEGIEMVLLPGMPIVRIKFFCSAVVAVTGREVNVTVNQKVKKTWNRIVVPERGTLSIKAGTSGNSDGFRVYICIRGGFPGIPAYLGSKSTSVGLGGYQGRALLAGDQIALGHCDPMESDIAGHLPAIPSSLIPTYSSNWVVHVLAGPCDDPEYVTPEGIEKFYATKWTISASSNRMGIRLQSPDGSKIEWARENGGEGGSHPSNILDNAYAPVTVNINGDTPVILTNEGPDMGGYLCLCTVASAERWKIGQLNPGCTVQFSRISWSKAQELQKQVTGYYSAVQASISGSTNAKDAKIPQTILSDTPGPSILHVKPGNNSDENLKVIYRQAGDTGILVDFGVMSLDFFTRARIHAFQTAILEKKIRGLRSLCPCIRSIMCYFDPSEIPQSEFLRLLIQAEGTIPTFLTDMTFPGRRLTLPIVLDDRWNREALERYTQSIRNKAVYLPSNIQYLADNNGLEGPEEALQKLTQSGWLVFGVGFYLACPFLVPIDPRCRLEGQKMNPSRTYTPRGAIGIAGPVAAIYPIESPGGYQLYGRTLPLWQTWGKGTDYHPDKPWLLQPFDQSGGMGEISNVALEGSPSES
ncbi:hypothetical protein M422DRAFT_59450 [Sphaerobolus stellatus SS14]|nr:hypothetical protein M422DRAFT_59450 [Sphaerobolus stellatus SS14]